MTNKCNTFPGGATWDNLPEVVQRSIERTVDFVDRIYRVWRRQYHGADPRGPKFASSAKILEKTLNRLKRTLPSSRGGDDRHLKEERDAILAFVKEAGGRARDAADSFFSRFDLAVLLLGERNRDGSTSVPSFTRMKIDPSQLLFDVLKKGSGFKKGRYSDLKTIRHIFEYLGGVHHGTERSILFRKDVELLRQNHYRYKKTGGARDYADLVSAVYRRCFDDGVYVRSDADIFYFITREDEAARPGDLEAAKYNANFVRKREGLPLIT
jgi:hypothetical protein